MRVLVTGACGFVGGYLCSSLLLAGHKVFAGVHSRKNASKSGRQSGLEVDTASLANIEEVQIDITDARLCEQVISQIRPQAIIHLAALTFVPDAEKSLDATLKVNVLGVDNVLRPFCLLPDSEVFIHVSSANVYGVVQEADLPLNEKAELRPVNNYSLSKIMAETVVQKYANIYQKNRYVVFRPFNHIGPGQAESFVCSSFAKQLAEIAHGKREPKIFVGNLDAKRDFTDVRDIVLAYAAALDRGQGVYNLSSGLSYSVQSMLEMLIAISGIEVEIETESSRVRPSDLPDLIGDSTRASKDLMWIPKIEVKSSLEALYQSWFSCVAAGAN